MHIGAGTMTGWRMSWSSAVWETLASLAFGFAVAGLLASAFELVTARRAGFGLLRGGGIGAVACVPVVVLAAPFIILRNSIKARLTEARPLVFVAGASAIAALWSLMSGRVLLDLVLRLVAA